MNVLVGWKLKFMFCFMEITQTVAHKTNYIWCSKISWECIFEKKKKFM